MNQYDIAIIGGGPAGLMAAAVAAESKNKKSRKIILIEKNESPGKKLLLTGNGRCNLAHQEYDIQILTDAFGPNGIFLYSALADFGLPETVEFFESKNLPLKYEEDGRVFPESDKAEDVLNLLRQTLENSGVTILTGAPVSELITQNNKITSARIKRKKSPEQTEQPREEEITAKTFILATGGKSYPETGSTGQGYTWAETLGHTVTTPAPALVPIKTKEEWTRSIPGVSLKNKTITIYLNNNPERELNGDLLFTHYGLSGPVILNAGGTVGELLKQGRVTLSIDMNPGTDIKDLEIEIRKKFAKMQNRTIKTVVHSLAPQKLAEQIISLAAITPNRYVNSITKEERWKLTELLKKLEITVDRLGGFDQAMVTRGGINLDEVDPKTMQSKLIDNLYFAGEILDLDGPTGGYNLQMCWSTGHAAGTNAARE